MVPNYRLPRILTVGVALLALVFAIYTLANLDQGGHSPWEDRVPFYFPYLSAVDQHGRSYVVDSAMRRLVALESNGTLRYLLEGGRRDDGFYYAHGLAVDSADRLYVYNWVPLPGADFKAQEIQIQRYRANGSLEKTLYRLENTADDDDFPNYFGFFIDHDRLFTLFGDGKSLTLSRLSLEGGASTTVRTLLTGQDFVAVAGTASGRLAGAARDGSLWEAEPGQDWKKISVPGVSKPWDLKYQSDDRLLILDLLGGSILRREADGSSQRLLTSTQTQGVFADTMTVALDGTITVADKDRQRLLVSKGTGHFTAFQGAVLSPGDKFFRWFFWGSAVAAVVLTVVALVLVYFYFVNRRLPLLFIQLILFVPIIVLVQAYAFNRVYEVLSDRYRGQVRSTLLNAANLTARLLPGADVQALQSPGDFGSPAYERLKTVATSLRKSGQESSAFNYLAIYRLVGGQPYYV